MERVTGPAAERLFVAVPLAKEVRERIAAALPRLPGRPTSPAAWHLTLRFLGDTAPERRAAVAAALERAELGPAFEVRFAGFGAFPRPERARVLWLGVAEGAPELGALHDAVEAAVRGAGFPPEEKPYTPHLTLARLRAPASVRDFIATARAPSVEAEVREVVLYRSRFGGGGVRHEALERLALGAHGG